MYTEWIIIVEWMSSVTGGKRFPYKWHLNTISVHWRMNKQSRTKNKTKWKNRKCSYNIMCFNQFWFYHNIFSYLFFLWFVGGKSWRVLIVLSTLHLMIMITTHYCGLSEAQQTNSFCWIQFAVHMYSETHDTSTCSFCKVRLLFSHTIATG